MSVLLHIALVILFFNTKKMAVSPTPPPELTFSMGGGSFKSIEYDTNMDFDPELVYAQVIAEAKMYAQMSSPLYEKNEVVHRLGLSRSLRQDYNCFSSLMQTDPKARRSWKRLISWRSKRHSKSRSRNAVNYKCSTPMEHPSTCRMYSSNAMAKSKSSYSAPVIGAYGEEGGGSYEYEYGDEIEMNRSSHRFQWRKPTSWGSSIAGALSPAPSKARGYKGARQIADFSYVPLNQPSYSYPTSTSIFHHEASHPIYLVT